MPGPRRFKKGSSRRFWMSPVLKVVDSTGRSAKYSTIRCTPTERLRRPFFPTFIRCPLPGPRFLRAVQAIGSRGPGCTCTEFSPRRCLRLSRWWRRTPRHRGRRRQRPRQVEPPSRPRLSLTPRRLDAVRVAADAAAGEARPCFLRSRGRPAIPPLSSEGRASSASTAAPAMGRTCAAEGWAVRTFFDLLSY
jgi:hypothetical protein